MATAFKQVKNNAKGALNATLLIGGTSAVLQSGQGAKFPTPGNSFWATIWDAGTYSDPGDDPNMEIVLVTARSTDTLTITRAQLSTSAVQHAAGQRLALLVVDQSLIDIHTAINSLETLTAAVTGSGNFVLSTGATIATPTITSPTVSGGVLMSNTFIDKTTLPQSVSLPAGRNFLVEELLDIGSSSSVTVPATSSLEIITYLNTGRPAIANFTSAQHDHTNTANGGALGASSVTNSAIDFTTFDVYSTSETNTGRLWTDGRPIYRKVLLGTMNVIAGAISIGHGITGFSSAPELIDIKGSIRLSTSTRGTSMNLFYHREAAGNWIHPVSFDTTNVGLTSSFAWGTSVYTIILEYVK